jgi:hypothetical protein
MASPSCPFTLSVLSTVDSLSFGPKEMLLRMLTTSWAPHCSFWW